MVKSLKKQYLAFSGGMHDLKSDTLVSSAEGSCSALSCCSKIFFLAVNTGYVQDRLPDQRCQHFYRARSRGGLYCAIVGNVVIPDGTGSNDVCAQMSEASAWAELASAIAENGVLPGIQLTSAWPNYQGMKKFVAANIQEALSQYRGVAQSLAPDDIRKIFRALDIGSEMAIGAGFKHIQLHAAHGYLFNLLIDARISPHADLALSLTRKWAEKVKSLGAESSLRFSLYTGFPKLDGRDQEGFEESILSLRVGFYDVSSGFYNFDKRLIYPTLSEIVYDRRAMTLELARRHPEAQFIISGKSPNLSDVEAPRNVHRGICRDLIANPNYLGDAAKGCSDCMKCHYYSRGQKHLSCGQWLNI